ncbi:MAG: S24 family peptidase [Candidatus Shapirobacteria bacterium]
MLENRTRKRIFEMLSQAISSGEVISLRNIGDELGLAANTILYHIKKLEEKGLVIRNIDGKVIRINSPEDNSAIAFLPLLGNAACGEPLGSIVETETIRMIPVPLNILGRNSKRNLYMIEAVGDSMAEKIENGDYVIFEPNPSPNPGQIVVARTKDGFTIKVFKKTASQCILKPLNPNYLPLVFDKSEIDESFNIDGVAVGIFKPQGNLGGGG